MRNGRRNRKRYHEEIPVLDIGMVYRAKYGASDR